MASTGYLLERAGFRHRIHPAFIAAIAAFEGGFDLRRHTGLTPCLPFNPYGLGSCGRAWSPPRFESWSHSIRWFARWLRTKWPRARTVFDYHGFCPPCGSYGWGVKVAAKMRQLGFTSTSVRYP